MQLSNALETYLSVILYLKFMGCTDRPEYVLDFVVRNAPGKNTLTLAEDIGILENSLPVCYEKRENTSCIGFFVRGCDPCDIKRKLIDSVYARFGTPVSMSIRHLKS
jgi:hypothetical protein